MWCCCVCGEIVGNEPHHTTAFIGTPGEWDTLISYSYYSTDHFWNAKGKKLPTFNHFHSQSGFLYSEYAWNSCNSFWISGGYTAVRESLNGNSQGIDDVEVGWKHLLASNGTNALTAELEGIIPVGKRKSSVRYGTGGAQASLLYSDQFFLGNFPSWYDLGLGYLYYHGGPSDQVRAMAALGLGVNSFITFVGSSLFDCGVGNGNRHCNSNNVVFAPDYKRLSGQIECLFSIHTCSFVSLGAFAHLWGRNVGAGGGCFGGIWLVY